MIVVYILVLEYLKEGNESNFFNLGSNKGYLVKEMLEVVREVIGKEILVEIVLRRVGDFSWLVVLSEKVREILGWKFEYIDIKVIIKIVWDWYVSYLNGYEE